MQEPQAPRRQERQELIDSYLRSLSIDEPHKPKAYDLVIAALIISESISDAAEKISAALRPPSPPEEVI